MKRFVSYFSTLFLGVVFLFSATVKAWDGNQFAETVMLYGPAWFSVFAPVLIAVETILATSLLLRLHTKRALIGVIVFLVSVSIVFLYGVLFKQISDCECFGRFHTLSSKPWLTFVRNTVFVCISTVGVLTTEKENYAATWKYMIVVVLSSLTTFVCGLSMSKSFRLPVLNHSSSITHQSIQNTRLTDYLPLSSDSTYVVYLFSFTCVHCQNSFANVEQYKSLELVDNVFGLAVEDNEGQQRFERIYNPSIPIYVIPQDTMVKFTKELPLLLFIRNGMIENTQTGSITSPGIFVE